MAQPRVQAERVVGFDCEFVDPPPEHLIQSECPVCLMIIRDPHQATCCGKKFCQSCIQQLKSKLCPTCQAKEIDTFPDVGLKCSLYSLKVRCSHQKDGCEWTGELRQLDGHLNTDPQPEKQLDGCQFVEICCIYNCGDKLQRRYSQTHQVEHCTKRSFSCEHCHNYESNFDDVIHNHWLVCGSFPLYCPNQCGLKVQRQNVDSHVADKYSLTTISCDFLHVGCAVKLPRKDMPEHLRENLLTHISLLATIHAKQQVVITKQQAEINELKSKNTILEQTAQSQETKLSTIQAELASIKMENESLKVSIEESYTPHKDTTKPQSHVDMVPRNTIPLCLPILPMTYFKQHKKNGDSWYSPLVYTHSQGYKICLRVDAKGWVGGRGTHVSVAVHFMKGEFDNSLKWPFRGAISFQLLDQAKEQNHKARSIIYDDMVEDQYCSRVTGLELSLIGRGTPTFIAHTELEPKYVRNDTLLFQVHKVELR